MNVGCVGCALLAFLGIELALASAVLILLSVATVIASGGL